MSAAYFGPVIITVIVTTIIAPILLKMSFHPNHTPVEHHRNPLLEKVFGSEEYHP
jgi:hypothetical protein